MRRPLLSIVFILAVLAGFAAAPAAGAAARPRSDFFIRPSAHFDARAEAPSIAPTAGQTEAILDMIREYPDVHLDWNASFGTVKTVLRYGRTLTGPRPGPAVDAARRWLAAHAGLYGWTRPDVAALRAAKDLEQPRGGPRIVLLHQVFGGLEGGSFGGSTVVSLDGENRILAVRSNVVPSTALAGGSRLSEADALRQVSGIQVPVRTGRRGMGYTAFAPGGFAGSHHVRKVAFPVGGGPTRPALEVFFTKALDEGYRAAIDAATGRTLYKHQLVVDQAAPEGRVFKTYPGAPMGGRHGLVSFAGDPEASPFGWVGTGPVPVSAGNNAHTGTNWTPAGIIAPDGNQVRAVGTFKFPFTDAWHESNCGQNPIGSPQTPTYTRDTMPAIVNLFYHHNVMHDYWWNLGFTGEAGAMQAVNFEEGASPQTAEDPLLGLVQAAAVGGDLPPDDPAGRDNAYMFPNPDGLPQWSAMFLFQPIPPTPPSGAGFLAACVDGDFAADVIYHEYTHGVTERWVGGEFGNLDSSQGGAMGESWGDLYGLHYLHSHDLETGTVLAPYDSGNRDRSFRNWALDEVPVGFGDLGYDVSGDEVHSDGEIWNGAIWDLRGELAEVLEDRGVYAMQLVADAMPMSGPLPGMLDMRDAILAADEARSGGEHQTLMWKVFARHGMGLSARSVDASDISPIPAFDHLQSSHNGKIAGTVVDARTDEAVSGARVMVGEYEARVTPVATTGTSGAFNVPIQEGTYTLTIAARGYGVHTFDVTVKAGKTLSRRFGLSVNFASETAGAKVVQSSNPSELGLPEFALDDTEQSTWWTEPDEDGPEGEFFVVDLAGDSAVRIQEVQVSAMRSLGGSRFEAVRDFTVYASLDGEKFTKLLTGHFSGPPPRPLTPDLNYQRWSVKPTRATFLKFVADSPMIDYGRDLTGAGAGVQVAEVQAFGEGAVTVEGGGEGVDPPVHDEGMILVATSGQPPATPSPTLQLYRQGGAVGVCPFPPPTQGIDAWVTELPDTFGDSNHVVDAQSQPVGPDPLPDIDLYFFSQSCKETGSIATSSPRETGFIPQGTKYVLVQLWSTLPARITVDASSA